MKFEMTNETLRNLAAQPTVTLSDMLGVFKDMINDVKGGGTLAEIETGDTGQAVRDLASVTRSLMSLSKNNIDPAELSDSKQTKLAEISENLTKLYDDIRTAENIIKDIDLKNEQLEKRKSELAAIEEEKRRENSKASELEAECGQISAEIERLNTLDIPEIQLRKEHLEDKLSEAQQFLDKTNAECVELRRSSGELGELVTAAETERAGLEQSIAASREQYRLLEEEIVNKKSRLEEEIGNNKNKLDELRNAEAEAQRRLDTYLEAIKQFDLPEKRRTYERAKAKIEALRNLSAGLENTLGLGDFVEHYKDYAEEISKRTDALERSANDLKSTYFAYIENMENQLSEFEKEIWT